MDIREQSEKIKVSYWLEKLHKQQAVTPVFPKPTVNQSPESKGTQEATQSMSKQKTIDKTTIATLIKKSNKILVTLCSHRFPFDFFPNVINIEEARVTIIRRDFFSSSQIHSVDIADISNIFINVSFFFAQIIIVSRTFAENNIEVDFLKKDEAIYMRRIIEGLRVFDTNKVDTANLSRADILRDLEKLSTTAIVT